MASFTNTAWWRDADRILGTHTLHRRSMKLPAAARQLRLTFSTVRLLALNGELQLDPETDTSGARFVTRASVQVCWLARNEAKRRKARPVATVPFAEVVRFTGLGRRAVVDLVRAGVLEELPGRRSMCEITTTSLEAFLVDHDEPLTSGNCSPLINAAERGR